MLSLSLLMAGTGSGSGYRRMTQCGSHFPGTSVSSAFSFQSHFSFQVSPASTEGDHGSQGASSTAKHCLHGSHGSFYPLAPDQESWSCLRRLGIIVGAGPLYPVSSNLCSGRSRPSRSWAVPSFSTQSSWKYNWSVFSQLPEQWQQTPALGLLCGWCL